MFKQIRHFLRERKKRRLREKLVLAYVNKLSFADYPEVVKDVAFILDGPKKEK